jgi:hypothetical protein
LLEVKLELRVYSIPSSSLPLHYITPLWHWLERRLPHQHTDPGRWIQGSKKLEEFFCEKSGASGGGPETCTYFSNREQNI